MASYMKRGKTWQYTISIKDPSNKKYKRITKGGFRTKAEAISAATQKELLLKQGYKESTNVLLADYFSEWMEVYKKPAVSPRTYTKYETTLNSIKRYFVGITLDELNKKLYQQKLNEYASDHAPESTSKFNNHIRQCIRNAAEEKVILDDFTKNAVISGANKTRVKAKEEKFLNYEDMKRVIAYFKEKLDPKIPSYYMIILAFTTGLRFGELLGLTWEDIDFENNEISVNKAFDYHVQMDFIDTKTYSSARKVFIDDTTAVMLKDLKKGQEQLFKEFEVINSDKQVFYHYIEGIVSNNAVNKCLKRALKKLDISPIITMHGARHTFGSILIYKGIDLTVVSEILGHKDTNVTTRVYIHVIKELRNKNKSLINELLQNIYLPYK